MRALQRDARGYPIPFIVLRDPAGKPYFAVNRQERVARTIREKRCPICGNRLARVFWFVGGPQSAFSEHGAYVDTPMHQDCMEYALRVCPYLAMPGYMGSVVDSASLAVSKAVPGIGLIDHTMIPGRPQVFVAVAAREYELSQGPAGSHYLRPARPHLAYQFWRYGARIDPAEAVRLIQENYSPAKLDIHMLT